jgi:hypothetical protein
MSENKKLFIVTANVICRETAEIYAESGEEAMREFQTNRDLQTRHVVVGVEGLIARETVDPLSSDPAWDDELKKLQSGGNVQIFRPGPE